LEEASCDDSLLSLIPGGSATTSAVGGANAVKLATAGSFRQSTASVNTASGPTEPKGSSLSGKIESTTGQREVSSCEDVPSLDDAVGAESDDDANEHGDRELDVIVVETEHTEVRAAADLLDTAGNDGSDHDAHDAVTMIGSVVANLDAASPVNDGGSSEVT